MLLLLPRVCFGCILLEFHRDGVAAFDSGELNVTPLDATLASPAEEATCSVTSLSPVEYNLSGPSLLVLLASSLTSSGGEWKVATSTSFDEAIVPFLPHYSSVFVNILFKVSATVTWGANIKD